MKAAARRLKLICVITFAVLGLVYVLAGDAIVPSTKAFSAGPPPGHTGAPGELTCANCHVGPTSGGTFVITPPANYAPGQTYQIVVRHTNPDQTRDRWGFQLTALHGGTNMAGSFATTNVFTQVVGGVDRDYIEHTEAGTFSGSTTTVAWTFNWTAPATDVGQVTFYAAGNQANGDGTPSGDRILTTTATSQPTTPAPAHHPPFDFDGDDKTDIGIFRPGPAEWWVSRSSNSQVFATQFGEATDSIVPSDYTGDGKADIAIWRPSNGFWFILRSDDFSFFAFPFGSNGDIAAPANFDGDSKTDPTVFRPSSNTWFISRSSGGTDIFQFGSAGDVPVPSDYDGDGKADVAIYRPSLGQWWVQRSTAGLLVLTFGTGTDRTVHGDYTGDGKSDIAVWRPSTGEWFILRSEDLSFYSVPFGTTGDIPVVGDYDGDGRWDTGIFRPSETNWYVNRSTAGVLIAQFGATGDRPIPNAFVR